MVENNSVQRVLEQLRMSHETELKVEVDLLINYPDIFRIYAENRLELMKELKALCKVKGVI